jgi:xanthine dehydrogenase accessory factor
MWLQKISEWHAAGIPCALVTIIESSGSTPRKTGSKMAVSNKGEIAGSVGGGGVEFSCISIAQEVIKKEICIKKRFVSKGDGDEWKADDADTALGVCGGSLTVFIEPVIVEPEIVIFGAGHIGEHIGKLCEVLAIPYKVYDDRIEFANTTRFPGAKEVVCAPFKEIEQNIALHGRSYCVILTYGHEHDEEVLEQLLKNKDLPYIGMIGSIGKCTTLIQNLKSRGTRIDDRLYAPIGLKIGKNLPPEIALSIIAEIVMIMKGGKLEHARRNWS